MTTPPHNIEAEQSVIGGILLNNDVLPNVLEILGGGEFYRAAHRIIFAAVMQLFEKNEPCDSVTLVELLRSQRKLEEAGGASYLASLIERVPSSVNTAQYTRIVQEKYIRRQTLKIAQQLVDSVATGNEPIEELIGKTSYKLANIEFSGQSNYFKDQRSLIKAGIDRIEARAKHPSYVSGVPTPFRKLNQLTNGLQPSDLVILAGRPSMGKSAIAQQMSEYAAQQAGPVAIFSLEMDTTSLMDRSFASNAQIPSQKVRSGHLGEADWSRLVATAGKLSSLPILTNDAPSLTAQQIRFLARQAKARMGGLALVVIDYLQLVRPEGTGRQRYLEVGETPRTLKQMARELKVPVLLLSQLNRSCEARENKRPLLSDLRESGDIEQDADVVMFIYRDEYYCHLCSKGKKSECTKGHQGLAEIIVASIWRLKPMQKKAGFSILELMVTIGILAILAAVSLPGFIQWRAGAQLSYAAQDIYSNFQKAKVEAAIGRVREALKKSDMQEIKSATEALTTVWHEAAGKMYQQTSAQAQSGSPREEQAGTEEKKDEGKAVDADYEVMN